jgi:hypothetical protein
MNTSIIIVVTMSRAWPLLISLRHVLEAVSFSTATRSSLFNFSDYLTTLSAPQIAWLEFVYCSVVQLDEKLVSLHTVHCRAFIFLCITMLIRVFARHSALLGPFIKLFWKNVCVYVRNSHKRWCGSPNLPIYRISRPIRRTFWRDNVFGFAVTWGV